jgi:YbgC/YbaW family acyl-CoA thioester hydrolase
MKRSDFRFLDRLRVRWAEIDAQHIVFNGHYLMYFDTAVAGWWRALALPYHDAMALLQGDLYVRKATLEYEGSARYDDLLDVGVRCLRIGKSSMVFAAAVFRGAQRLVHGELVYVFADPATQTSKPVPPLLRDAVLGFEDGEAMVELQLGDWQALGAQLRPLREAVFVREQRLPAELAADTADESALHVLALNRLGMPLAAARLLPALDGVAQIGRVLVVQPLRGASLGQQLLAALVDASRQRGDRELWLQSEAAAAGFYERAGFARSGPEFMAAGLPHVELRQAL